MFDKYLWNVDFFLDFSPQSSYILGTVSLNLPIWMTNWLYIETKSQAVIHIYTYTHNTVSELFPEKAGHWALTSDIEFAQKNQRLPEFRSILNNLIFLYGCLEFLYVCGLIWVHLLYSFVWSVMSYTLTYFSAWEIDLQLFFDYGFYSNFPCFFLRNICNH